MEYTLKQTLETDSAIIRVYSPVISEEERAAQLKKIHNAAANLLRNYYIKGERQ